MDAASPNSNITATQLNYPTLPRPHSDEAGSQLTLSSWRPAERSSKRRAGEIEGDETDLDETGSETSESEAPAAGPSRKERRTTTKDTPSKGKVSFASMSTSFASATTSFVTAPTTPSTGHRSRRAFDEGENGLFTSGPLQMPSAGSSSLLQVLRAANGNPSSQNTFNPETPRRRSGHFPPHLPSPSTPGLIGSEAHSTVIQDALQAEFGIISKDMETSTKLMGLIAKQAKQAEGIKRG